MNPLYDALRSDSTRVQVGTGQNPFPQMNGPFGALQGVMQRAGQLAQNLQNPQRLVQQYFPDAPAEVSGDPDQLIGWLQQTGRVSPQMVQMARQMVRR